MPATQKSPIENLTGVLYGVKYCRQKVSQKMCQKISVIKTNSFDWGLLTFDDIILAF